MNRARSGFARAEWLPAPCTSCGEEGYVLLPDPDKTYQITCAFCGKPTSYAWCPDCQIGGPFVTLIESGPTTWVCPTCSQIRPLPPGFMQYPLRMVHERQGSLVAAPDSEASSIDWGWIIAVLVIITLMILDYVGMR